MLHRFRSVSFSSFRTEQIWRSLGFGFGRAQQPRSRRVADRTISFRPSDWPSGNCTTMTLANLTTPSGRHDPCPLQLTM